MRPASITLRSRLRQRPLSSSTPCSSGAGPGSEAAGASTPKSDRATRFDDRTRSSRSYAMMAIGTLSRMFPLRTRSDSTCASFLISLSLEDLKAPRSRSLKRRSSESTLSGRMALASFCERACATRSSSGSNGWLSFGMVRQTTPNNCPPCMIGAAMQLKLL